MKLIFNAVSEPRPGSRWQSLFQLYWPAYRAWFLNRGGERGPSLAEARRAMQRFMPELLPIFERLIDLTGGDELAARMLSMYRPPAYLISCSQAALTAPGESVLVRNYDLDPQLNEGLILHSRWRGQPVIASSEFLWGVADGMNGDGLALSLAFGGRRAVGDGFGIPLILRYVLETCATVAEAIEVLRRVPSHMAYNVTLLDRQSDAVTVQVAPDRETTVLNTPVASNHQGTPEWTEHARFTATVEREQWLRKQLAGGQLTGPALIDAFARPPLYNTDYQNGFGTLYTAVYRPQSGKAEWRWPNAVWSQDIKAFKEGQRIVHYSPTGARALDQAAVCAEQPGAKRDYKSPISAAPVPIQTAGLPSADKTVQYTLAALRQALAGAEQPWSRDLAAWCEQAECRDEIHWETFGRIFTAHSIHSR